jgi:predicted TPR repeat methyltransferase
MDELSSIDSAFALHAAGALADAEIGYRRILAANPQHVEAQHYLGVLLHQQGDTQQGISLILRALEADASSASRYNDLGNILVQTGDFANAVAAFRLSVELNDGDANVWNNLGSVLHRQQDFTGAESAYRSALQCAADFVPALNNLAALLAETGREEESSLFSCQAFILPPLAGKSQKILGIAYYRLGRLAEAAECYRAWLHTEPDNAIAQHFLAACTGKGVPARASDGFVTAVFDDMAESFNDKLVGKLEYRGPEIIAGLLNGYVVIDGVLDVLDGGCGTGLCAPMLAPYAARLTGVDLSPGMLTKARECNLYDALVEVELTAYLLAQKNAFDLIVMADTLIYFGDLAALFIAVGQALRPGGSFAFTAEVAAESAQQVDYHLRPSGRYAHSQRYLLQVLDAAGFIPQRSDDVILRREFCRPTQGLGILARILPH